MLPTNVCGRAQKWDTVRVRSFFGYGSCVATATVLGIMPRVVTRDMYRSSLLRRSCPPLMSEVT